MPPRFAYWTIIAGGLPTAFRAAEREALLPTFKRIQERHPDAQMRYFARGKLWASQEEATRAAEARRSATRTSAPRGRDWRPGGEHRDPRQTFKDAKKARNLQHRKRRFERRTDRPPLEAPHSGPLPRQARPANKDQRRATPASKDERDQRRARPAKDYRHPRPPKPRGRS